MKLQNYILCWSRTTKLSTYCVCW